MGTGSFKAYPFSVFRAYKGDSVRKQSNEGDVVLDPFMGSGTTAKMALLNNRHYIGFDVSEEYCQIAQERVSKIVKNT